MEDEDDEGRDNHARAKRLNAGLQQLKVIDRPFIVLTETKFSFRCIPVWDRYSPHRTRVEKKSTCDNALTMTAPVPWSLPYSLGELGGVLSLLPVNPSQCSLVQVINTNVTYMV